METRSSSKDYAYAQDDAVNKWARKSMEGKELAPRDEHKSEHGFGEGKESSILQAVNQNRKFRRRSFVVDVLLSMIR